MANPQDLLNQYLNAAYSSDPKKQDVALTAETKKQALNAKQMYAVGAAAVTGLGGNAMPTQEENDLLNLDPYEILQKYGHERGIALLTAKYQGVDAYNADDTAYRDTLQTGGDLLNQAISGFGQTIGGIGAWGVGLVSDKGGAALSGALDDFNRGMSEMRSDASTSTQEAFDARSALREQASTARYNEEIAKGSPDWAASLARHGGDALGAAGDVLTNPTHFADLAAQGVGSMAAIPLIAGELATAVPAGVATRLIAGAIGPTRTAVKAGRAVEKALPATAAIGLTEAGGTFVQATNEVMNIPQTEIEKLPEYQERIAAGMKPEEARLDMANDAGNQAALTQLPAALAAGAFVSKFEAAPGARRSVTDMLANLGKETLEEGTQSATSQLAVNQAIKSNVDAKRERTAGVGTQFGVGAVAGFGTAGAIQTPGVIAQGVADTFSAAKSAVDQRLADLHKANEDASPVSESKVRSETEMLTAESPNIISIVMDDTNYTPEKKTDLVNMVNTISGSILSVNPEELASDPNIPPVVHEAAKNAPNQVDMLSNLARIAMDTKRPMEDRVSAQGFLAQTLSGIDGYFQAIRQDELKDVAEDDVLQNYVSVAERVFASLRSSPAINQALETSNDLMASAVKDTPLTENSTPEQAAIHLAAADLAPETTTRESVDTLLKMATKGKLQLNEQQYTNLTMLKKLFDNAAAYDAEIEQAGAQSQDIVSRAIKTGTSGVDGELSALQHAQGIRQALVQGDVEGAKARLEDLGMFAQHMQNKVNALNSHMATKNPTKATAPTFQKLVGTLGNRSFVDSNNTIGVTPTNANSIRQSQLISAEANFVTNAFNILAETFPQLDIQPMELVELDAQLDGRPEELAAQFTAAKEKAKQQPKAEAKPAPAKAEPVQKKAAPEATDLSGYTNHSGGAKGSDSVWDIVGRSFGLGQSLHYYGEGSKTPLGNTPLTPNQLAEADPALIKANKSLGRHYPPKNAYVRSLLQRNYYQVRNSDAVYAIGNIAGKLVEGGTGWAVQMAIDMAKPVYVFNQKDNLWYTFSNGQFVQTGTPALTKNFAGIGTREITKAGEQAIREVYEKTLSELGKAPAPVAEQQAAPAPVRSQEVTPEFEQTKLTAIRAMSDADLKRHLKTLTNDLMNEDSPRKARVVEMITTEQEARASLAQETAEPEDVIDPEVQAVLEGQAEPALVDQKYQIVSKFNLNNGQKNAFQGIMNFLGETATNTYALIGSAGTGKTTIVDTVLASMGVNGMPNRSIILSAPTHRANAVTRSKNDPSIPVMTLHSLLGLTPEDESLFDDGPKKTGFTMDLDQENKYLTPDTLLIVDESSMIDDALYAALMDAVAKVPGIKVLFLGDAAQLKPVNQTTVSKALTATQNKSELTKVERAKNASLLVESVHVRTKGQFSATTRMEDDKGVAFTNDKTTFLNGIIQLFQSAEFKTNPMLVRMVTYQNRLVSEYNKIIRNAIHGNPKDPFVVGDLLMGYQTFGDKNELTNLSQLNNGLDYMVTAVSSKPHSVTVFGVPVQTVSITVQDTLKLQDPQTFSVALPGQTSVMQAVGDRVNKEIFKARVQSNPETRRKLQEQIKAELSQVAWPEDVMVTIQKKDGSTFQKAAIKKHFDYGYAHTIHKSQGGTYKYVFVDNKSIRGEDTAELRYVGMTRAQEGAFILTSQPIVQGKPIPNGKAKQASENGSTMVPGGVVNNQPEVIEPVQEEAAPVVKPVVEPVAEATIDTTDKSILTPVTDLTTEALQAEFDKLDQLDRRLSRDEIARFQDVADELERREDQAEAANASESDATVVENPLLSAYPTLIGGASNRFVNTFNLPMNPISKLDGSKTPIRDVLRGLKDTVDDIGAMRAFQAILGDFPSVLAYLNGKMNLRLGKKSRTVGGKTLAQATIDGSIDPTIYPNGRAIAIAEIDGNKLALNTELTAKAYLAGVNWLLNGMSFVQLYDIERASKMLGIPEEEVTDEQMELLSRGVTRLQAIDALAANIQRYWGVTKKADVVDGFTKGIPQAVAANLIDMMLNQDFNGEKTLTETKLDLGPEKDLVIYTPVSLVDTPLNNYRSAIEKLVSATPELVVYMGENKPPVAKTQLNNPTVQNTPDQIKMIENQNATGYTVNLQTLGAYEAMGIDNIIALFGEPNTDKTTTNKNTLVTREGRNTNIVSAWDAVNQTLFQMELQADEDGVPVEQVQIHYAHNITSVGRAQQLGRYTPQSSKLMRTVFLPTNSKPLDLTDTAGQDWQAFMLSMGQLLGVKVHNVGPVVTEEEVMKLTDGKFKPVIEMLQDQIQSGRAFSVTELNMFKSVLGKPTFETFQALVEYARFLNTEDKSQYVTQLYLEADGMSNGPFNSMALFSMGNFTPDQLKNLAKCGLYFGGAPETQTSWVKRQEDTVDLYEEVSVRTLNNIREIVADVNSQLTRGNKKMQDNAAQYKTMQQHMNQLMGILLPDVVKLNEDGDIATIKRNITKNPTTITTYGSGKKGIGDKLTNSMLDNLYARISDALLAQANDSTLSAAEAMFPNDPKAAEKLTKLDEAMKALTTGIAVRSKKQGFMSYSVPGSKAEQIKISTEYTIDREAFQVLTNNVFNLIVNPMDAAIQSTIHPTVSDAVGSLRTLTQVQGIILANAYQKRVNELVAKKGEEGYIRGGYLSAKQQQEILQSLAPLHPQIQTGDQNYFIAGGEKANLQDKTPYGASFNDKIDALPTVYAPTNPGVKGIATMVIGSGDGMTIQQVSQDPTNTERALFIFDGINYPLDFIREGSVAANKAALDAILGNPMQEVSNNFNAFLAELSGKLDSYTDMSTEMKHQLGQAMFGLDFTEDEAAGLTADILIAYMEGLAAAGRRNALDIQARHNVMQSVNFGMDQMAAAGSPYLVTDRIELVGTQEEVANQLTQLYQAELKRLQEEAAILANDTNISRRKDLQDIGVQTESGAVVLTGDAIRGLVDRIKNKVPRSQQLVLTQAIKNVLADGYKVISGSYDQLMAYNQNLGANGIDASRIDPDSDQGITLPDRKEIWLLSADSEVLAHEFVHAATYSILLSYMHSKYGTGKSPVSAEVGASIDAIEQLMNQFMDMKDEILKANPSDEFFAAYMNTRLTIIEQMSNKQYSLATRTAAAVNEYMAWSLSNQELVKAQSKIPVRLTTILWETLKNIRNWLFGSTTGRNVDDMLSNLAYHTKVVMSATQPSLPAMTKDTSLMMARVYGHDQRLADLDRTFDQKIADYVTAQGPVQQARRTNEVGWSGINALHMIGLFSGNGFPMTAQEANTFYKVVAALGTQAKLDPAVMNRMQELYAAATRELTVESFMKDPEGNNPADYAQAEKKYEVVMGQRGVGKDPIGRSTLMPAFMALALTNDTFREVLAKLPVPRTEASTQERAFDRLLENQANKMLDQLSDVLSGQKRSANVQQAIDNLAYQLVDAAQQSQGFYDQYVTPLGTLADKANAAIVESMSKVADKFTTLAEQRRQVGKDRKLIDQAINNGLEVAASIINEEKAGLLGEAILAGANASQSLPKWMHDLIADLVGRVDSNADLYDMIKKVRSSIQRLRNQFRTELPKTLAKQFTRKVTKEEWSTMNTALGKSDLAAVVQNGSFTRTDTLAMLGNQPALNRGIRKLEDEIKSLDSKFAKQYLDKAQQLATFMMTGVPGQHLARNARAIVRRLGTNQSTLNVDPALERAVDSLVSLYAVNMLSDADKQVMGSLVQSQKAGVEFTFGYALGLHNQELSRLGDSVNGQAFVNHYKGHMPSLQQDGVSLRIDDDKEFVKLAERSYVRKAAYAQSSLDRSAPQSYYFAPVNGRSNFNQGIVQNVRQTMGGVDSITGYTVGGLTGGRITDPRQVARIAAALSSGRYTEKGSNLLPVYNAKGDVVAYERSADPTMLQALNYNTNFGEVLGAWKGRLAEETLAVQFNQVSVEYMAEMYRKDTFNNSANKAQYVDLFDTRVHNKYPVIEDALKLFTPSTVDAIHAQFPDGRFWVRKEMLDNVIGYRSATVGDAWTGNTYWSKETQEAIRKTAMLAFGNKAYANFVNAEQTVQGVVQDAKTLIIIKSIVVPVANMMSNMLQLVARGVPVRSILAGLPKKLAETRQYVASEKRAIEAEAELHATTDAAKQRRLKVEIQSIRDSYKRMSIWPLIERGELSSMSDDAQPEDQELVAGKLNAFIEAQVNKLPPAIRAAGKYALITKDTALYKGLRKSVEYGDFLAKAILWDDLVNRQGKDVDYANGRITEEFVNFDRLGGRNRQYLEAMGLLWFYNFKIRSAKVGLSIIRNNPLHALMAATIPAPSSIGSPITDNVFSLAVEGRLGYSIGLDQLIGAPMMHPLDNMLF